MKRRINVLILAILGFLGLGVIGFVGASSIEHPFSGMIKTGTTIKPAVSTDLVEIDAVEFTEDDTDPTCASGNYNIYADLSETAIKTCQDGVTAVLGAGGSEWTDTGTVLHPTELTDDVSIGSATLINAAKLSIDGDADQVQFAIQGNATQTTNIMEIEDSGGTELFHVTNSGQLGLQHIATLADDHAIQITADAAGFGDVKGISLLYTTGAISGVEHADSVLVNIDQSASTGGDVMGFEVLATDSGGADVHGLNVGVGVSPIRQNSGVFGTVGFCEVETSGPTFTDCVTAFNSAGTDVQIWIADNDRVNIGHATTFEEISWLWDTVEGNPGIMPTFEYTTGAGPTWAVFTPTDGTNGARNNGIMEWDSSNLTGWSSEALDGDAAFWIRITRTCNPCTGPTEDLVEVASPVTFSWNKSGDLDVSSVTLVNDLAVTEGGSGAGTFTDGGILLGSGTGAFTPLGVAANGQIPIGDGATDPVLATITGTANEITVTNGAGSITLDIPTNPRLTGQLMIFASSGGVANALELENDTTLDSGVGTFMEATSGGTQQGVIQFSGNASDDSSLILRTLDSGTMVSTLIARDSSIGIIDLDPSEATLVVGAAGVGNIFATFADNTTADTLCWDGTGASLIDDCTSLLKHKENIIDLPVGLSTLMQLQPRQFDWKKSGQTDLGFIAEEVEVVSSLLASYARRDVRFQKTDAELAALFPTQFMFNEVAIQAKMNTVPLRANAIQALTREKTQEIKQDPDELKYVNDWELSGVKYRHMVALLVQAIQEQQIQITALQAIVAP